jgi:branched-chain amino acid transport system permease protein
MSNAFKVGLWSGVFGIFTIALFGGRSVLMCSLICGVLTGILAGMRSEAPSARAALRLALAASLVAGVIQLVANIIRHLVLSPMLGQPPQSVADSTQVGLLAMAVTVGLAALLTWSSYLPGAIFLFGRQVAISAIAQFVILAAIVVIYPFLDSAIQLGWISIVITSLVFILLALGLNVVVGYAGLLDLGYAAFFAIGAYTVALLSSNHLGNQLGYEFRLSFWLVLWLAAGMAALFGLILGSPTLPLRGDYLAIVTLGFGEIVPIVFRNLDRVTFKIGSWTLVDNLNLTGGEPGISPIDPPYLPGLNFADRSDQRPWYFLLLAIIVLSVILILRMRESRMGRAWMAMREDELAAAAMGINIVRTKLLAFSMGASFSGFGGAFFAAFVAGAFPSSFDFSVSVIVLCMVILGGLGSMTGVVIGGLIIELSDRLFLPQISLFLQALAHTNPELVWLQRFDPNLYRFGLFGLVLVLMMLLRPEGIVPNDRRRAELHETEDLPPELAVEAETVGG